MIPRPTPHDSHPTASALRRVLSISTSILRSGQCNLPFISQRQSRSPAIMMMMMMIPLPPARVAHDGRVRKTDPEDGGEGDVRLLSCWPRLGDQPVRRQLRRKRQGDREDVRWSGLGCVRGSFRRDPDDSRRGCPPMQPCLACPASRMGLVEASAPHSQPGANACAYAFESQMYTTYNLCTSRKVDLKYQKMVHRCRCRCT